MERIICSEDGSLILTFRSSEEILMELSNSFSEGFCYVPFSFQGQSTFRQRSTLKIALRTPEQVAEYISAPAACDVYDSGEGTRLIMSRDKESFFVKLTEAFAEGYVYKPATGRLTGSFVAHVHKVAATELPEPDGEYSLEVALAIKDKKSLVAYCEKHGIEIDKSLSLSKIQKGLQNPTE